MTVQELARQIRLIAIQAPNSDTLSCEFDNWFAPKVEELINKFLNNKEALK